MFIGEVRLGRRSEGLVWFMSNPPHNLTSRTRAKRFKSASEARRFFQTTWNHNEPGSWVLSVIEVEPRTKKAAKKKAKGKSAKKRA